MTSNNNIMFIEDLNTGKDFTDSEIGIIYTSLLNDYTEALAYKLYHKASELKSLLTKMENELYQGSLSVLKESLEE